MGFFKRSAKSDARQAATKTAAVSARGAATPGSEAPQRPAPSAPVIDPFFGDTELRDAVTALRAGDWRQAEAFLDARNDPNWSERVLRGSDIPLEVTTEWAEQAPSCRSLCFRAAGEIDAAWKARGTGFADTVGDGAAQVFFLLLLGAKRTLEQAIELDSTSPEPWGLMLTVGMGLGSEIEESQQRFDEAHRRMPFHTYSVRAMTNLLLEKWGGSEEQVLEFSRWVNAEAPADSPSLAAIPMAWMECSIMHALKLKESGQGASSMMVDMSNHLEGGTDEHFRTIERVLGTLGDDGVAPPELVGTLNELLFLTAASNEETARLVLGCITAIDNRPSERPWNLLGDPVASFQSQQQHAIRMAKMHLEMKARLAEIAKEQGIELRSEGDAA